MIKKGCALMVVFSHNKVYSIGMFNSEKGGRIFDGELYWFVWRRLSTAYNVDPSESSVRMMRWQHVDLDELDTPLRTFFDDPY